MKGIYALIWLTPTGDKIYIGSSVGIADRLSKHLCHLRRGGHFNAYAQNLFNKYGEPSTKILEEFDGTEPDLRRLESDWLDLVAESRRVNLGPILPSTSFGRHPTKETKLKMSEAGKRRTFSDEHRRKISEAHLGKPISEASHRKLLEANLGKHHTEEHRRKLSEVQKGKPKSDETRRKMSESHKKSWATRKLSELTQL